MKYLTLEELKKMDKSDVVYVRKIILYAHQVRIQHNRAQDQAFNIIQKAISSSQDEKTHIDYYFAEMSVGDVLFVFENYFKDYKNLATK